MPSAVNTLAEGCINIVSYDSLAEFVGKRAVEKAAAGGTIATNFEACYGNVKLAVPLQLLLK